LVDVLLGPGERRGCPVEINASMSSYNSETMVNDAPLSDWFWRMDDDNRVGMKWVAIESGRRLDRVLFSGNLYKCCSCSSKTDIRRWQGDTCLALLFLPQPGHASFLGSLVLEPWLAGMHRLKSGKGTELWYQLSYSNPREILPDASGG
jgi:hypothetical protein